MSVIGTPCLYCNDSIIVQADASKCLRCGSVFHRDCAVHADHLCPQCKDRVDYAERIYRYSSCCPDCLTANPSREPRCVKCGAWTRWDDELDYQHFVANHRRRCRSVIWSSLLKVLVLAAAAFVLLFALGGVSVFWVVFGVYAIVHSVALLARAFAAMKRLSFA
jgi:hypothetical protein